MTGYHVDGRLTKLKELEGNVLYYYNAGFDKSNAYNGIVYDKDNKEVFMEFRGGDFKDSPYRFAFKVGAKSINLFAEADGFKEKVDESTFDINEVTLDWMDDISSIPYHVLMDITSTENTKVKSLVREIDADEWDGIIQN